MAGMTTQVNDIADFVRILRERPDWLETIRGIIVGEELLNLPNEVAKFVAATNENFRLVHERLDRLEAGQAEIRGDVAELKDAQAETNRRLDRLEAGQAEIREDVAELKDAQAETNRRLDGLEAGQAELKGDVAELKGDVAELREGQAEIKDAQTETNRRLDGLERRFNRMEGRFGNLEGSDYERKARQRILFDTVVELGLNNPVIAMTQDGQSTPEVHGGIHRALRAGRISREQARDLRETDLIISDDNGTYVLSEASITASDSDIERAVRRAGILALALDATVLPVVATSNLAEPQRALAERQGVSIFMVRYP